MTFKKIVEKRLDDLDVSPIRCALDHGLPRDAIRSVLRGHPPSIDRARDIADALGLEFYIGLPRKQQADPQQPTPQPPETPQTHPLPTAQKSVLKEKEYRNSPGPGTALAPVRDKNLARLLAWIIDEWAALNDRGRTRFTSRFRREFTEFDGE